MKQNNYDCIEFIDLSSGNQTEEIEIVNEYFEEEDDRNYDCNLQLLNILKQKNKKFLELRNKSKIYKTKNNKNLLKKKRIRDLNTCIDNNEKLIGKQNLATNFDNFSQNFNLSDLSININTNISNKTNYSNTNKFLFLNTENESTKQNDYFSILTYNILHQNFIKKNRMKKDLMLKERMTKIIYNEIKPLNPDILCLQEVDLNVYKDYILKNFNKEYDFVYGENFGSFFINVIGFKKVKFDLLSKNVFNLNEINIKCTRGVLNAIIQNKINRQIISIYNIHFPWRPKYLYQKCFILEKIGLDIQKNNHKNVLILGDFNSTPDMIPLKLLYDKIFIQEKIKKSTENDDNFNLNKNSKKISKTKNKFINYDSYDEDTKNELPDEMDKKQFEEKKQIFNLFLEIYNLYRFRSSYENYKLLLTQDFTKFKLFNDNPISFTQNHMDYTYFTESFRNTIDYIFYSNNLELIKILRMPEREELSKEGFLPSKKFPSDHIKLFSEFKIKN